MIAVKRHFICIDVSCFLTIFTRTTRAVDAFAAFSVENLQSSKRILLLALEATKGKSIGLFPKLFP